MHLYCMEDKPRKFFLKDVVAAVLYCWFLHYNTEKDKSLLLHHMLGCDLVSFTFLLSWKNTMSPKRKCMCGSYHSWICSLLVADCKILKSRWKCFGPMCLYMLWTILNSGRLQKIFFCCEAWLKDQNSANVKWRKKLTKWSLNVNCFAEYVQKRSKLAEELSQQKLILKKHWNLVIWLFRLTLIISVINCHLLLLHLSK